MDQGLFAKYGNVIQKQHSQKEKIITLIKEKISIDISQEEITLEKNKISFRVSSVKKMILFSQKTESVLQEAGYILQK